LRAPDRRAGEPSNTARARERLRKTPGHAQGTLGEPGSSVIGVA